MTAEHEDMIKQTLLLRGGLEFVLVGFGHCLLVHAVLFRLTGVTSATRGPIVALLGHPAFIPIAGARGLSWFLLTGCGVCPRARACLHNAVTWRAWDDTQSRPRNVSGSR